MKAQRLSTSAQYVLAALLVLPVLVMSVFPQGTMAARGTQGLEVVLCTGDGPVSVLVDEDGTPIEDQHADAADCGWWLLGQALVLSSSLDAQSSGLVYVRGFALVRSAFALPSSAPSIYPARAPPLV